MLVFDVDLKYNRCKYKYIDRATFRALYNFSLVECRAMFYFYLIYQADWSPASCSKNEVGMLSARVICIH